MLFVNESDTAHECLTEDKQINRERIPFVRTGLPDHFRRNENFTFRQNYPARSVNS